MREICVEMKKRRVDDKLEDKFGWYQRHWKSGNVPKDATTQSLQAWDEQCATDPVFDVKPKKKKNKKNKAGKDDNEAPETPLEQPLVSELK